MKLSEIAEMIITLIHRQGKVTYEELSERATKRGISLDTLDASLEIVHRDKTVNQSVVKDEIVYRKAPPPKPKNTGHIEWARENYPEVPETCKDNQGNFKMAFPEWNLSWMFLSPQEIKEYKAEMRGNPTMLWRKRKTKSS